jgi:SAM-dependent methyltransferase
MATQHPNITTAGPTTTVNQETIQHWLGFEQHYDAAVARQERRLQQAAAIAPTDRVLDVGCGCGDSTRNAARSASAGQAYGVDLIPQLINRARHRASELGLVNATFDVADAQVYPFVGASFDLIISRHGATFFADSVAAFGNLRQALRPEGRIVLVAWAAAEQNEWLQMIGNAVAPGTPLPAPPSQAPGPFGFAEPSRAHEVLLAAGLQKIDVVGVREPMWLGADAADAFNFVRGLAFVRGLLRDRDLPDVAAAEARLRAALEASASATGVELESAAWLISARNR